MYQLVNSFSKKILMLQLFLHKNGLEINNHYYMNKVKPCYFLWITNLLFEYPLNRNILNMSLNSKIVKRKSGER